MEFHITWQTFAIILPSVFIAGFIDAIAGGGGLISVPAYLASGLPAHFALGNNKFSSSFGTLFAVLTYHKNRIIDLPIALLGAGFALAGSYLGTRTVLLIDPGFLRYVLVFLIPAVTVFTLLKKNMGVNGSVKTERTASAYLLASMFPFIIGFYDGFFGPGTGAFLILFYTVLLKYDFMTANANTKVVNLASNAAAIATFIVNGKVLYMIGIPAALCGIAGNILGARLVIFKGSKVIRPFFIAVLILLLIKIVYDMIK